MTMKKYILQACIAISASTAAFMLGLHVNNCKKNARDEKASAVAALCTRGQQPSILVVYREDRPKSPECDQPGYYESCGQRIVREDILPLTGVNLDHDGYYKPDTEYLIKWDEQKDRLNNKLKCAPAPKSVEIYQCWLADLAK
jgi:hypothetical protein